MQAFANIKTDPGLADPFLGVLFDCLALFLCGWLLFGWFFNRFGSGNRGCFSFGDTWRK
jgi:hypothetical protein